MTANKKIQRKLKKLCPDCGEAFLDIIGYTTKHNGIEYSEKRIECLLCGYTEKTSYSPKHIRGESDKW